jgi:hypothetical protein
MWRTFQAYVVIDQLHGIAIKWQHPDPFAFALDPDLQLRELDVLTVEGNDLA